MVHRGLGFCSGQGAPWLGVLLCGAFTIGLLPFMWCVSTHQRLSSCRQKL